MTWSWRTDIFRSLSFDSFQASRLQQLLVVVSEEFFGVEKSGTPLSFVVIEQPRLRRLEPLSPTNQAVPDPLQRALISAGIAAGLSEVSRWRCGVDPSRSGHTA